MNFLGIGPVEILIVLAVALIAFGPQRLPELARHVAKAMKMFREASNELQRQLDMTEWEKDHSTKKSSYTSSSSSSSYKDPYNSGYGESGYDSNTTYASEDLAKSSSSEETTSGTPYTEEYNAASQQDGQDSSIDTPPLKENKPIDDPNKIDDAQRYSREMTD